MSATKNQLTFSVVWRSILLWIIVGGSAVIYNLTAFTMVILPVHIRHKVISSWAYIFTFFANHLCKVKYTVVGLENLIGGSAIIASNHQSMWETIAFATIFPQHVWILKREILRIPFFGWTVATLSPISIDRSKGLASMQQIMTQSVDRIKQGFWILVFPEGTRVTPGVKKAHKIGVARMANSLKIPVIPVAHNAGYCIPKASHWVFPGEIKVIIDKPVYPVDNETIEQLCLRIEQSINKNLATITH